MIREEPPIILHFFGKLFSASSLQIGPDNFNQLVSREGLR
jgi:hypothetical protein